MGQNECERMYFKHFLFEITREMLSPACLNQGSGVIYKLVHFICFINWFSLMFTHICFKVKSDLASIYVDGHDWYPILLHLCMSRCIKFIHMTLSSLSMLQ